MLYMSLLCWPICYVVVVVVLVIVVVVVVVVAVVVVVVVVVVVGVVGVVVGVVVFRGFMTTWPPWCLITTRKRAQRQTPAAGTTTARQSVCPIENRTF